MRGAIAARQQAIAEKGQPGVADVLPHCDKKTLDLVSSFQRAVVEDLVAKTLQAAREREARMLFVTGGVAANSELPQTFTLKAANERLPVYFPPRKLSTATPAII